MTFSQTVAIAAVSTRVVAPLLPPRAAAVAVLKVTGPDTSLGFTFHTHVPRSGAALCAWLDPLIADDPLLTGYRLGHISRLLEASGYNRRLAASFSRDGRSELFELARGRPIPLSVAVGICGMVAIDEEALVSGAPLAPHVVAELALVNAVASWVVHVHRSVPDQADADSAAAAIAQLSRAIADGSPLALTAATVAGVQ